MSWFKVHCGHNKFCFSLFEFPYNFVGEFFLYITHIFIFTSMIVIDKDNNGSFVISLMDKVSSYVNDDYDFKFVHEMTHEELNETYTDISTHKERFQLFDYITSTFQNSTSGFWTYYVEYNGDLIATGRMLLKTNLPDAIQYDGYDGEVIVYEK